MNPTKDGSLKNQGPADTSKRPRDDVNDDQPYANRAAQEDPSEAAQGEFSEGDRGALSGHNLEQLEQARLRPGEQKR